MKSKTTLAGAFTAAGVALWGGPVALSTIKFEVPPSLLVFCIWGGLIMNIAGVFIGALFSADSSSLEKHLNECKPENKDANPPTS